MLNSCKYANDAWIFRINAKIRFFFFFVSSAFTILIFKSSRCYIIRHPCWSYCPNTHFVRYHRFPTPFFTVTLIHHPFCILRPSRRSLLLFFNSIYPLHLSLLPIHHFFTCPLRPPSLSNLSRQPASVPPVVSPRLPAVPAWWASRSPPPSHTLQTRLQPTYKQQHAHAHTHR